MAGMSTYLRNALLNTLRNQSFSVATVYVSLHDDDPGDSGDNEITGGSYARQAVTLTQPSGGASESVADVEFTDLPAVTLTHVGLWDAATNGNFLWGGPLTQSKAVDAGDSFVVLAGDLDLEIS